MRNTWPIFRFYKTYSWKHRWAAHVVPNILKSFPIIKFIDSFWNKKFCFSVSQAMCQVLNSCMWATVWGRAALEYSLLPTHLLFLAHSFAGWAQVGSPDTPAPGPRALTTSLFSVPLSPGVQALGASCSPSAPAGAPLLSTHISVWPLGQICFTNKGLTWRCTESYLLGLGLGLKMRLQWNT